MRSRDLRVGQSLPGAMTGGFPWACAQTPSQARRGLRIVGATGLGRGDGGFPANAILVRGLRFAYY